MNAMAHLGSWVWDVLGPEALVDRSPCLAAVVSTESSGGRDRNEHALWIERIEQDCMQAHTTCAGLPVGSRAVAAKSRDLLPRRPAVRGAEQGRVLDAGVNRVRISQRRLEMPDALELPGMRRAVVPLVCARNSLVGKVIADRLPTFAAVARALDLLAEPAARL